MGLSSLPILNKTTATGSWSALWQTNRSSSFLLNTTLAIEIILKKLTQERVFYSHVDQPSKPQAMHTSSFVVERNPTTIMAHTFIGEVWFLQYADVLIISPMYLSSKYVDEKKFKIKVQDSLLVAFWLHYHHCF